MKYDVKLGKKRNLFDVEKLLFSTVDAGLELRCTMEACRRVEAHGAGVRGGAPATSGNGVAQLYWQRRSEGHHREHRQSNSARLHSLWSGTFTPTFSFVPLSECDSKGIVLSSSIRADNNDHISPLHPYRRGRLVAAHPPPSLRPARFRCFYNQARWQV